MGIQTRFVGKQAAGSSLRIVVDDGNDMPSSRAIPRPNTKAGKLSINSTLADIYGAWFERVALQRSARSTCQSYRETLGWWMALTSNPKLKDIDDTVTAEFAIALSEAKYQRGTAGKVRYLSECTQAKHLRNLRCLLNRCGQQSKPNKPALRLIYYVPYVCVPEADFEKESPFSIEEARKLVLHCADLHRKYKQSKYWSVDQWRLWVALMYYTGFRVSTVNNLEWSFIKDINGVLTFDVPAKAVSKTKRGVTKAIHPQLAKMLELIPRDKSPYVLRWPAHPKGRWTSHQRLQRLAGIPQHQERGIHAWRRTHATQLALLGAEDAVKVAQVALAHKDKRVTEGHYVNIESVLVRALPNLF